MRWMTAWIVVWAVLFTSVARESVAFAPAPDRWQDYGPREQDKARRNYQRYLESPPTKRREVERQYERWQGMPEQERERIRRNYERYQGLPPQQRREFDRKYQEWQEQRGE
jgi:hypothetical protein